MKIDWMNDELTEARVTRGWWKWQQVALITRRADADAVKRYVRWAFASGRKFDHSELVEGERENELERRADAADWLPVSAMPAARVVKR